MTNETFKKHKAALAVERSVKPKTLNEECSRYWRELQRSEYHFKRGVLYVGMLVLSSGSLSSQLERDREGEGEREWGWGGGGGGWEGETVKLCPLEVIQYHIYIQTRRKSSI